jgi:EmrB/QacA subfamily drug resistance transporter
MSDAGREALRAPTREARERPGRGIFAICLVQLMVVLDVTIVNVSLPSVRSDLGASLAGSQWVVTTYALTFGGLLLLGGRAGDVHGRKRVFLAGSLCAGLATEPWQLITARAFQGSGAAAASPTALALIATTIDDRRLRGRAMAMYAAMSGLGAALGLVLGGALTEWLSWRWTFLVNVPVGVLAAALAATAIREAASLPGRFDLAGAVTGTLGVAALVYGCSVVTDNGAVHTSAAAAFACSLVLLIAFVRVQATRPYGLMPLVVVRHPDRGTAYLAMFVVGAVLFSLLYFTSRLLQVEVGFGPLQAGLGFLPFSLAMMTTSQAAARHTHGSSAWRWVTAGLLVTAGALGWLALTEPNKNYALEVLAPLVVAGIGLGAAFVPLTVLALVEVRPHQAGLASGVVDSMQQLGGAVGIAVLASLAARTEPGAGGLDEGTAFAVACALAAVTALVTSRRAWTR